VGLAIDPLYIAEVSPSVFRGKLVSMSEIAINMGILLGMAADYAFLTLPDGTDWRLMLGLGLILPSVLLVLTLTIMPESPRFTFCFTTASCVVMCLLYNAAVEY
jgi:hypothetical protein